MAEETAGGLVGRIAGKAREAVGSVLGNHDLETGRGGGVR
jgi:uncharacterized protein YjbJ (UPF0337 family)